MSGQEESCIDRGSQPATRSGSASRFERRWRLIGAGLSNVWRFGDLDLPAASGRLLLRGPNGTGKTTALEALAPYLLDLNAARLSAGKARTTNLSSLMREGATGRRRYGYAWLTLAGPDEGTWSFGVRIQYSEGASPPTKVIPFAAPGRPLHELKLYTAGRGPLEAESFAEAVTACGGQLFDTEEDYVSHLAVRLFGTPDRAEVARLASRLREVRNPALLGDVSPQAAADALRESLPGVAEDVISATADALAESDATREAFARDKEAAEVLEDFRAVWCAHATEIVSSAHAAALEAGREVRSLESKVKTHSGQVAAVTAEAARAKQRVDRLESDIAGAEAEIKALEDREAYQEAGRLNELKNSASAEIRAAEAAAQAMRETARAAAVESESLRRELDNIIEDLTEYLSQARRADPTLDLVTPLLSWTHKPRAVLRAGEAIADPGAELVIHGDAQRLRDTASALLQRAQTHALQADAAALAISDHKPIEALQSGANEAAKTARETVARADSESAKAKRAEVAAYEAARSLLDALLQWTTDHPQLIEPLKPSGKGETQEDSSNESPWSIADVEQLADAEPGQVLAACDAFAHHAVARAEALAGEFRVRAQQAVAEATRFRTEAASFREEASLLRAGRLLPLPRPDWAGPGDDSVALGAALDWPAGFDDPSARALLEAAMAAAGLLGASLTDTGADTRYWHVNAAGPAIDRNLSELVAVDTEHPLASVASAVLSRVRLVPSAMSAASAESEPALLIGRDGTFRAGVLRGRVPGADDPALLSPASHIGARQRRAAALARAEELERQATQLDDRAAQREQAAAQLESEASAVSALGRTFPPRDNLRAAESHRAELARIARDAQDAAGAARREEERLVRELHKARAEWLERTRSRGLPGDVEELTRMRDQGVRAAEILRKVAGPLGGKLAERLDRVVARYSAETIAQKLVQVEAEAKAAFRTATDTQTALRVLEETAGAAIAEVLARHESVTTRLSSLQGEIGSARTAQIETAGAEATARAHLEDAEKQLREAQPKAVQLLNALRTLVAVPGVADAVLDGDHPADDVRLLDQIAAKLRGRKTITKKTVRERADAARAKLAGIWALDPGDDHGELLTYVITHRDATYTPTEAAAYAQMLKTRAEQALAASEERALREFVIGRLPGAISTAWTRLKDWNLEVNRKMRSAAASSGVGVQVQIPLRGDLAPAERTVYELSCKVSDAERTPGQQRQLGEALRALIEAAEGESMQQRVASAVNIRDWVDVYYEVTRPGGKTQRWNSKTGLSGGERRLVVLAPMLAAIAAAYDRFGEKALRLVTLDEVPAEVDDRGREGLARYIAQLDLDLVCTSYLWDGCPGAWDGIDAHDLEAGPDGTVVAFPMLVRGLLPIPEVTFAGTSPLKATSAESQE